MLLIVFDINTYLYIKQNINNTLSSSIREQAYISLLYKQRLCRLKIAIPEARG
jgi:hypothetical protein